MPGNLLEQLLGLSVQDANSTPEGRRRLQAAGYSVGGQQPTQTGSGGGDGVDDILAEQTRQKEGETKLSAILQFLTEMRQRREGQQEQPSVMAGLLSKFMQPTEVAPGNGNVQTAIAGMLAAKSQDNLQRKMMADLVGGRIAPVSQLTQAPQQGNIQDDLMDARSLIESILNPKQPAAPDVGAAGNAIADIGAMFGAGPRMAPMAPQTPEQGNALQQRAAAFQGPNVMKKRRQQQGAR